MGKLGNWRSGGLHHQIPHDYAGKWWSGGLLLWWSAGLLVCWSVGLLNAGATGEAPRVISTRTWYGHVNVYVYVYVYVYVSYVNVMHAGARGGAPKVAQRFGITKIWLHRISKIFVSKKFGFTRGRNFSFHT